ncbi:TetR/AcrR family transcriptional regulator [Pyxidicoccus trucidator]|uniref:TetR/AcrR family transcriptional regulator n=1 Tax=Pyxidicoccus trucidator TaxID=2709662 RepID=UPI0013DA1546|nr:TetR/AcrR family transcriptional regulator [Pyxidicoccus trucidator]
MSPDPRIAILNAAGEVFARFGFKKASVEDIARRAGVGKGSIYLHFESKEALFEVCVRQTHAQNLSELKACVARATTPEAQVRAFIRCKLDQHTRAPVGPRIEMVTLFELGTQAVHLVPEMMEADAAVLVRVLEAGVAQGVFAVAAPQLVARGFLELLMTLAPRLMTQEPDVQVKQALDSCFEVFIRGLASPPAPSRHKR